MPKRRVVIGRRLHLLRDGGGPWARKDTPVAIAHQYNTPAALPWGYLDQRPFLRWDARRGFTMRDSNGKFALVILYCLVRTAHEMKCSLRTKWKRVACKIWKGCTRHASIGRSPIISS